MSWPSFFSSIGSASKSSHDLSMLAAERTTPWVTTPGTVIPMGESPRTSSKWSTIWSMTSATASGVDCCGVSIRLRLAANSPLDRSTGAPLMPLPPTSMPSGRPVLLLMGTPSSEVGPSGEGEDLVAVVGDEDRVLELGRAAPVAGDDGPLVVPHVPRLGAEVEHRLDG